MIADAFAQCVLSGGDPNLHRMLNFRLLFEHLVPIALVIYHLLKGTDVMFFFCLGGSLIVHSSFWSASLIGRTSPEHQGSRGTSDA
jgi:hypothetical protein